MIRPSSQQIESPGHRHGRGFPDEAQKHYRALLQRLDLPGGDATGRPRTLGIAGCTGGEGVSTVAAQLAAAAAADDHQVLLVDANLASPSLQKTFTVDLEPGLAESLFDGRRLAEAVQPTPVANLSVLAAGNPGHNPTPSFQLTRAAELVAQLPRHFDLTVFDLPPVQSSSAIRTAAQLDGVLLVLEAGRTDWETARRTAELLTRAGTHVLGVVLNKRSEHGLDQG